MSGAPALVRPARPDDWSAIRSLCCLTGRGGTPIERVRWPFFAALWVGPYERLAPEWTFVAEDRGQPVGYLTGCPDTLAFERARAFRVTLPLLAAVVTGRYGWTEDTRRFVRRAFGLARLPEDRVPARLRIDYPAHLHMNVVDGYRSRGIGGAMLDRYLERLRASEVAGVHLLCGPRPVDFYRRHGFQEVGSVELAAGGTVFALGRRLS